MRAELRCRPPASLLRRSVGVFGLAYGLLCVASLATSSRLPAAEPYDLVLRGGLIYDGSGGPPRRVDLAIQGDRIAELGPLEGVPCKETLDVSGLAVTPGFINMLSWSTESLLHDGLSQGEIRQGVTLELFGEGTSMGPLNETMRRNLLRRQTDIQYDVSWRSLRKYLDHLQQRGVSPNVASLIGAGTIRVNVLGYDNRPPTPDELKQMEELVREEMEAGAMGVGSSLIYAPDTYAGTPELVALCRVAGLYGGIYASHMRSEGNQLLEATDELLRIAEESPIHAHIFHLKAAGRENWPKLPALIEKVERAQQAGLGVTADMYTYTAGATGLNASMPPWVQEGGYDRWRDRLRDPAIRQRVAEEMKTPTKEWENLLLMAGSPDRVLLVAFDNPALRHLTGKSLAEVARLRQRSVEDTAMDLVIEDGSRVGCVYFMMSEENVRRQLQLPWVAFDSDAASMAPEGVFLHDSPHPRAYGNFARLLGKYVREEQVLPLESAVQRLTSLPAQILGIRGRGRLRPGYFADVVVLDAQQIQDHATYEQPHQYATGVRHVFVNGVQVLQDGEHTGKKPGRVVLGPGAGKMTRPRPPVVLSDEARRVHEQAYVFDGHNDLPWEVRTRADSSFEKLDISQPQPGYHTDIPRLKAGNVGAQFWSVYVPSDTAGQGLALQHTLEQIQLVHDMLARYPETFELARNAADIDRIRSAGKIASLIGVEGGHAIEDSIANLRRLHELGARYMTLTHADSLSWADSATDTGRSEGLSPFGEEVVREMNRLGMLVDLSHVSPETMRDALRISTKPVIFSHSSARAVADHPRNVPDDVLRLVRRNGGVVMVNFFSGFIVPEGARKMTRMFDVSRELRQQFPDDAEYQRARKKWQLENPIPPGTIHDVVDHIDHIVRVAGIDHVGIGSDYDGVTTLPAQLEDVSTYPLITQELLNRGYPSSDIRRIMHGNIMRVIRAGL